jgi:tetratricopeptide (TPR) repeat protein
LFWLGNYQQAINEAGTLSRCPAALKDEKEEFVYRSYLALGQYDIVLNEVKESAPIGIRAIKVLAAYMANPGSPEAAQIQIQEWISESENASLALVSAILYTMEDNTKEAIKALRYARTMEHHAILIQLYLRMDRLDLALKELKTLKSKDEDCPLSSLATAWTSLYAGGGKVQEAAFIYDELVDKYGGSSMLLNGLAVAKMHQEQYEEAETLLQEALTKSPADPDTLANLICVCQHLGRAPEIVSRYLSQLKSKAPNHQLISSISTFEGAFERVAAGLA